MNSKIKTRLLSAKSGSALVATLVIATALSVILATVLSHSLTERRLNTRHELLLEANNAAEALVEYGFAQLRYKFEHNTSVASDALDPNGSDGLRLPAVGVLGNQIIDATRELVGGTVPPFPNNLTYIDPNDPDNEFDPLKGKMVRSRQIAIFGKASIVDPSGGTPLTSYVTQSLQVRDAPLFAHAIFYNLDLEISPGPRMDIFGPVHANGNIYAQGISGVYFYDQVTTAGHYLYGWGSTDPAAQGAGWESLQTGPVSFKNRDGDFLDTKVGGFMDSKMGTNALSPDWRSFASNRWNGNLQTADHGIENYKPVAFSDYEPDNPATGAYDPVNSGHDIIEPPLNIVNPSYVPAIEEQKMANKAGLTFKWDATTETVTAYDRNGTALDISGLKGSGSNRLWEVKDDAMWDDRRKKRIKLVEFNVGKLKQLIETPGTSSTDHIDGYDPSSQWNGIVYFETSSTSGSSENVARLNHSGIRVWGGQTKVTGQGIPSRGADPGMTFATNNALYVKGNFNADGERHQSSSSQNSARIPENGEVPVALFADSITILSKNWSDSTDAHTLGHTWNYSSNRPSADHTEVAAAIVCGLIPSDAANNNKSSGGVHNFPRFLENWSGKDLFIRGSIIALYESEVDDSGWRIDYYNPPARKWGFSEQYRSGIYPPGTPLIRTYRRVDYRELSKAEYETAITALPW